MAKNIDKLAKRLGAVRKGRVPEVGGGAFGMARLREILAARLQPGRGVRPGRPSDPTWTLQAKVPMSETTKQRLVELAAVMSQEDRSISPMQLAAQLLEDSLSQLASSQPK